MIDASTSVPMSEPVTTARLTRAGYAPITLTQTPDYVLHTPSDTPAGVYTLTVHTACGCFSAPAFVACPPPAIQGARPDLDQPHQVECCP